MQRQEDTSSLRLFSVDSSGRQMISNFSLRQRLHLLLELLYGECDARMHTNFLSISLNELVAVANLSEVEPLKLNFRH